MKFLRRRLGRVEASVDTEMEQGAGNMPGKASSINWFKFDDILKKLPSTLDQQELFMNVRQAVISVENSELGIWHVVQHGNVNFRRIQ